MKPFVLVNVLIVLSSLCGCVLTKECTNIPTLPASHTFRYKLSTSNNETWKKEVFSHYHLTPTDDSAWAGLLPRKMLKEEDELNWAMLYRKIKNSGAVQGILNEVSLNDVRLDPDSIQGRAQQTNLEYLMMLDVDRLVWSFRKTAGLEASGEPYGGWEAPKSELRGHFVGHYMSATAQMWASTHNNTLKQKMTSVISALSACQEKMGTGYLSAFPSEFFDRFEAIMPVWAPYYTIHKILAGLMDQYTLAGNKQAFKMATWMVEYFYKRVQNVISKYTIERHWTSLNEETGGMNDVLYRLYSITGDQKHLVLAHLFDKPCFLGLLAVKTDGLSGFHANTHIPIVVGAQMRYELTGDPLYKEIATFFMDTVNSSHSYATGGTSVREFWSDPKRLAETLETENEESCTTYNMLKVSRNLFRWTKEMAYADYYERALTNGVLSIQRGTDPGIMIYMLPLRRGASKGHTGHSWGTPYDSFWCCYGTGIESFSKLGDSIYFEEQGKVPALYMIQYVSSMLNWKTGGISLNQKVEPVVSWDQSLRVTFTISSNQAQGTSSTLNFRIPLWTYSNGAKASLNGQNVPLVPPGNFLSVTRKWSPGDKVNLELPMAFRTEAIKDERPEYSSVQAILFGPYLLTALSDGDWDVKAASSTIHSDWISPVPADHNAHLISLSQEFDNASFSLTNSDQSITMEKLPQPGTDSSVASTFRLVLNGTKISGPTDAIGKSVMLEPFNFPGMVIQHKGANKVLGVADSSSEGDSNSGSIFQLLEGLDGRDGSVSLESKDQKGCFVYSDAEDNAKTHVKLICDEGSSDDEFKKAASFTLRKGFSEYDPVSFVMKGVNRKFVMVPLHSLRDETYTAYFNFQAS